MQTNQNTTVKPQFVRFNNNKMQNSIIKPSKPILTRGLVEMHRKPSKPALTRGLVEMHRKP